MSELTKPSAAQRLFDLVAGTALSLATLPVVAVLAVSLAISFRAWPFFSQDRVGKGGKPFRFVKLRTLPPGTAVDADKYEITHVETTRLARILRAKHLDELPQLFLVVSGKMSLVGPRPEMLKLHERGNAAFAAARTSVKPGCAGLWQVSEDNHRLIWEAPEYDMAYLRHQSLGFDLWILWRTALHMLHLRPVVTFADIPRRFITHAGVAASRRVARDLTD